MTNDLRIIQFNAAHTKIPIRGYDIAELQRYRAELVKLGLLGKLTDQEPVEKFRGAGYGNISFRATGYGLHPRKVPGLEGYTGPLVIITGSRTGQLQRLTLGNFAMLYGYDAKDFKVFSYGMTEPSSESPMHWAVYGIVLEANAMIHGHIVDYDPNREKVVAFFKEKNLGMITKPTKYTKDICRDLSDVLSEHSREKIIGLDNHEGGFGFLAIGRTMKEAFEKCVGFYCELEKFRVR